MNSQYAIRHVVAADELDELNRVNNAVFLQYAEKIAREHADALGLGWQALGPLGTAFVVRRHEADYFGAAVLGEELTIRTRLLEMAGARAKRLVEILRGNDILFRCLTEWAYIGTLDGRPRRLPREMIDRVLGAIATSPVPLPS